MRLWKSLDSFVVLTVQSKTVTITFAMAGTVLCDTHGEQSQTLVCSHLAAHSSGLGFNRDDPTSDNPFPDAWCDDCELIRASHCEWNDQAQELTKISLLCSACYEKARIRNSRTAVTMGDLESLRWKCASCEEWHSGPCLDFGYDAPYYWSRKTPDSSLNKDYCAIEDRDFFVRGIIELPIIGTSESLRWGVWGSLSKANYETLVEIGDDPKVTQLPPMFSWLSTKIPEYPDTLSLKMYARVLQAGMRPYFEPESSDHPLSREYHDGISPERVKEIMLGRVRKVE